MSNETLMTEEAATTPEGQAASQPTEQQPATGADEAGQQQTQGLEAEGQQKPAEEAKPEGAPEKYEFANAEELDSTVLDQFSEVARELNLSRDAAQKVLDKMGPAIAERQTEQLQAARESWAQAAKADKEFGGEQLQENLAVAKQALDAFGSDELRTLLNESGLGNHPEVIRLLYRAGKATSEDGFVKGGKGVNQQADPRRLYPNSNMN